MGKDETKGNALKVQENGEGLSAIKLSNGEILDATGLSQEQISELKMQHAKGMIDLKNKAVELNIDVGALDNALSSFNEQTAKASQAGASATITHTQTSSVGRTEVVIGNTEKAASGKISRSARGESDKTLMYVIIVAVVVIIIAFALNN